MKCCEEQKSNVNEGENCTDSQHDKKQKGLSHMWKMVLCCGLPIVIILLTLAMGGLLSPGLRTTLLMLAPLICPLIMIPMMFMMMRGIKDKG